MIPVMRVAWSALIVAAFAIHLPAQNSAQDWAGEWGEYQLPPGSAQFVGSNLTLTTCTGNQCAFSIRQQNDKPGYCETSEDKIMEIVSPTKAVAHLNTDSETNLCSLIFEKSGTDHPAITVKEEGDCSYYCSSNGSFAGIFPLRSKSRFFGDDIPSCYAGAKPARAALCASQQLSAQQDQWSQLYGQVSDLYPKMYESDKQKKMIDACDVAKDPAACLANEYRQSMLDLNELQIKWQTAETQPGDLAEAKRKIAAITGSYRHTFRNGDVSGDTYWTTDTLEIQKASDHSILYSTELNFYNGHTCSRSGEAIYTSRGFFVDKKKNEMGDMCYFEIIPTATGVNFGDPTNKCRETDCGARGGFGGTHFSFKRRISREGKVHLDSDDNDNTPESTPTEK